MRKNKIRILHVAQAAGGVDRYIRMLLKYLDKEKFENILVCSQDFHEEDYKGLLDSFEQIEMTRAIGRTDLKAIKEVRALIKKYNPDIVYMAKMVCEKFGDGKINVVLDIPESNTFGYASDTKMKLNSDKLKKLGWKPEVDLEESYRRMILSMKIASD